MSMPPHITLPVAVVVSLASAIASGGVAWGAATARANAIDDNASRLEKRIEKLEDAMSAMRPMLERIDERTARTERAIANPNQTTKYP
jgi:outer membrane murein-binding lipoprotein Lpp